MVRSACLDASESRILFGKDLVVRWVHAAHQPLLNHGRHEPTVTREEPARRESTAAGSRRALLRVQRPVVGPKVPMEPHGMVEARDLVATIEPRDIVGKHGRSGSDMSDA